jgi:hypothetical protein
VELAEEGTTFLQRVAWDTVAAAPAADAWPGRGGDSQTPRAEWLDVDLDADLDAALLQEAPLLHDLTAEQVRTLLTAVGRRRVPAGTTIYAAGDVVQAAYVALDGALSITPHRGKATTFDAGRMGLALTFGSEAPPGALHRATATAATDVTLLAIRPADLADLAAREPALAETLRRRMMPT